MTRRWKSEHIMLWPSPPLFFSPHSAAGAASVFSMFSSVRWFIILRSTGIAQRGGLKREQVLACSMLLCTDWPPCWPSKNTNFPRLQKRETERNNQERDPTVEIVHCKRSRKRQIKLSQGTANSESNSEPYRELSGDISISVTR